MTIRFCTFGWQLQRRERVTMIGRSSDHPRKISQPSFWLMWTKHRAAPPRGSGVCALKRVGAGETGERTTWSGWFSSRHLSRKAARIDAEIDERVNDGGADERRDYDYQHFQTEGTHTGSLPKAGLPIKSGDSRKTRPGRRAVAGTHESIPARPPRRLLPPDASTAAPCALCALANGAQAQSGFP
jgi:hypothetical protein